MLLLVQATPRQSSVSVRELYQARVPVCMNENCHREGLCSPFSAERGSAPAVVSQIPTRDLRIVVAIKLSNSHEASPTNLSDAHRAHLLRRAVVPCDHPFP